MHYQVALLEDAKFLIANVKSNSVIISAMTYTGHDYLDSVRDEEIWNKTKKIGEESGAWSLDMLGEIAQGLIKSKIEKLTKVAV